MTSRLAFVLAASLTLGACSNLLDTNPPDTVSEEDAVVTPAGARRALAGAYGALQNGYYYGGTMTHFGDLYSDNATHTGTFTSYQDASQHTFFADNSDVTGMWNNIYAAIKRANTLIAKVPLIDAFDPAERDQVLGEAYFLRALHYHNLVKYFGGVPLRLEPVTDPGQIVPLPRSTVAEVYAQIEADLGQASTLMTDIGTEPGHATVAAARALLARVYLYQAKYPQALAAAQEVDAFGFELAADYSSLFEGDAPATPENIFELTFTSNLDQASLLGYYWLSDALDEGAGRYELAPTQDLIDTYDTTGTDARFLRNIAADPGGDGFVQGGAYGNKYRTPGGAEDFPVIRYAEIVLIKAEAFARASQLDSAVANYNLLRVRAGLAPHVLNTDVTTQADVLAAIDHERRLEFFEEGDRFPDLTRDPTRAIALLGLAGPNRLVFPIPQAEVDIAPEIEQNPGY